MVGTLRGGRLSAMARRRSAQAASWPAQDLEIRLFHGVQYPSPLIGVHGHGGRRIDGVRQQHRADVLHDVRDDHRPPGLPLEVLVHADVGVLGRECQQRHVRYFQAPDQVLHENGVLAETARAASRSA